MIYDNSRTSRVFVAKGGKNIDTEIVAETLYNKIKKLKTNKHCEVHNESRIYYSLILTGKEILSDRLKIFILVFEKGYEKRRSF